MLGTAGVIVIAPRRSFVKYVKDASVFHRILCTFSLMAPPVIAIDLDEVLGHFIPPLCDFHNEAYGTSITPADFTSYRFCEVWGGDDQLSIEKVHAFFKSSHFLDIPVVPGAVASTTRLRELGYQLVIVTSRQLVIEQVTREWIARHFPSNTFSHIVFGNHWGVTGRKISKVELCRQLNAQLLVDDGLRYVTEMAAVSKPAILFDLNASYAWNRSEKPLPKGITRVHSWSAVVEKIQTILPLT